MSEPSSNLSPAPETCPPPLAWQDVVQGVAEESQPLEFAGDGIRLDGYAIGAGPPLWFLKGFTGDCWQFALLTWLLRDRFQCFVADDFVTAKISPAQYVPRLADTIAAAAESLGHDHFAVYGSSFGSLPAISLLHRHRDRVIAGVLHSGFARRQYSLTERAFASLGRFSKKPMSRVPGWPAFQEQNHRRWFPPLDPPRWDFLLQDLGATPARDVSLRIQSAASTDLRPILREIPQPVQISRTEGDGRVIDEAENVLVERLPDVREETLHTTGHFAHVTHPHRVAKIVAPFVLQAFERTAMPAQR
jgi:pimeloyl-ACP methyl ester carboxylesterase